MTAATLTRQPTLTFDYPRAVRDSDLPPTVRLLLLMLKTRSNPDGTFTAPDGRTVTPSLQMLMEDTGLSRDTVVRCLDTAESGGWVIRDRPTQAEQYRGKRTQYTLTYPAGKEPAVKVPRLAPDPSPAAAEDLIPGPVPTPQTAPADLSADPSDHPPKPHNPSSGGSTTVGPPVVRSADQGWSDHRTLSTQNVFQNFPGGERPSPAPFEPPAQAPPPKRPPQMSARRAPVAPALPAPDLQPCGGRHPAKRDCRLCGAARKDAERAQAQAVVDAERALADAHPARRTVAEALNAPLCADHGGKLGACGKCRAAQHPQPAPAEHATAPKDAQQRAMAEIRAILAQKTGGNQP